MDEPGRFRDETGHQVPLTRTFDLCDRLVTQGEREVVMGWNDSRLGGHPERPIESVAWFPRVDFCTRSGWET